jgi:hypothetical protein
MGDFEVRAVVAVEVDPSMQGEISGSDANLCAAFSAHLFEYVFGWRTLMWRSNIPVECDQPYLTSWWHSKQKL